MKLEKIKIAPIDATICEAELTVIKPTRSRRRRRPQLILLIALTALGTMLFLSSENGTTPLSKKPVKKTKAIPQPVVIEEVTPKAVEPEPPVVPAKVEQTAPITEVKAGEKIEPTPVSTPAAIPAVVPAELPQAISATLPAEKESLLTLRSSEIKYQESISDESYVAYVMQLMTPTKMEEFDRKQLAQTILRQSRARELDPIFVSALIMGSSSFQATIRSAEGRVGLVQLSPESGKFAAQLAGVRWMPDRLSDPTYNLGLGLYYFHFLEGLFEGDVTQALLAHAWDVQLASEARSGKREIPPLIFRHVNSTIERYKKWSVGLVKPAESKTAEGKKVSSHQLIQGDSERYVRFLASRISALHPELANVEDILRQLVTQSVHFSFNPLMVASLIEQSSGFNPQMVSPDGRVGLLQLKPEWGEYISTIGKLPWNGEQALTEPTYNMQLGLTHLKIAEELFQADLNIMIMAHRFGAKDFIDAGRSKKNLPVGISDFSRDVRSRYSEWKSVFDVGDWERSQKVVEASSDQIQEDAQSAENQASTDGLLAVGTFEQRRTVIPTALPTPEVTYFDEELDRIHFLVRQAGVQQQEVRRLAQRIVVGSEHQGINPLLTAAIIKQRSNFFWFAVQQNPMRIGLFQIPLEQAEQIADLSRVTWAGADELKNPEYNLRLGISYLRYLRDAFGGNMKLALTAFFWDPIELKHAISKKVAPPDQVLEEVRKVITMVKDWRAKYKIRPEAQ